LDDYEQLLPTIVEIPSKDHPYDPQKDYIMNRIKKLLGQE
jgi:V-type H+-transporting ATPase subunit F